MKLLSVMILFVLTAVTAQAAPNNFDSFLTKFNYETRADMKIDSKRLIELLTQRKAVLIDIRFPEETRAWKMGFGHYIPLNELPKRLVKSPKTSSSLSPVHIKIAQQLQWPIYVAMDITHDI